MCKSWNILLTKYLWQSYNFEEASFSNLTYGAKDCLITIYGLLLSFWTSWCTVVMQHYVLFFCSPNPQFRDWFSQPFPDSSSPNKSLLQSDIGGLPLLGKILQDPLGGLPLLCKGPFQGAEMKRNTLWVSSMITYSVDGVGQSFHDEPVLARISFKMYMWWFSYICCCIKLMMKPALCAYLYWTTEWRKAIKSMLLEDNLVATEPHGWLAWGNWQEI